MMRRKARLHNKAKVTNQLDENKRFNKHYKKAFKKVEQEYVNSTIESGLDEKNT
ncbi:hypothetical protein DPMN_070160 [Dreissena polymorpha]|uniref:Uncharacterized protein n=1 Tax=Dreissena polymorpha TaxID=45954 RepID=A0A9D3Z5P0_DREPO|nr:hypothetical protein DPMN_070160 [Dreissena polymorpha]